MRDVAMSFLHDDHWLGIMKDEWKNVISKTRPELCKAISVEGSFIDYLESSQIFNTRTCQSFRSKVGSYNIVSAIINALLKRPYEDFIKFCDALEKSNQGHIVEIYFSSSQPDVATSPRVGVPVQTQDDAQPGEVQHIEAIQTHPLANVWQDLIRRNYPALARAIDPDHGLFDHLISKRIISDWMVDTFKAQQGPTNRASAILDHLMQKRPFDDFLKFLEALEKTNQGHVVEDYLCLKSYQQGNADKSDSRTMRSDSEPSQELDNCVDFDWMEAFVELRSMLVENIDASNDFLNRLRGLLVLNHVSYETCVEKDIFLRVEFLLDYMRRRPKEDFKHFFDALIKTNQKHIVDTLFEYRNKKLARSSAAEGHAGGNKPRTYTPIQRIIRQPADDQVPVTDPVNCPQQESLESGGIVSLAEDEPMNVAVELHPAPVMQVQQCQEQDDNLDTGPKFLEDVDVYHSSKEFYQDHHKDAYHVTRKIRGICHIINIYVVKDMSFRRGTERDELLLKKLFEKLHFEVQIHYNLSAAGIKQLISEQICTDRELQDHQCLVLFVLSHGSTAPNDNGRNDIIYGTDGEPVLVDDILLPLTDAHCQSLVNKPRLVFFQACRGDCYQAQLTQTDSPAPPVYRDFLIGYPTQRDYRSFRNTELGTWYINALVQVFSEKAKNTSLSEMLNLVAGKLAKWKSATGDPLSNQKVQSATYESHLTKSFYFFPGITSET